jgi:hypothetical protein
MACLQTSAGNGGPGIRPTYATEAACLEACKEGACCEGTTCSVKPQCQCQGAGKTFNGVGTACENNYANAKSVEVSISSSNRVAQYRQQLPERYPADSNCCLQSSDELLTSYVFAGQYMAGTFSLTKLTGAGAESPFSDYLGDGDWYYSFVNDDILFDITLFTTLQSLRVRAAGWRAWHYQLNENGWCNPPNEPFDCRSPTSHTAKYYGVGERQSAIGDDYVLSCPTSFTQQCSNGYPSPCFHGPSSVPTPSGISRRGQRLAGATFNGGADASVALTCQQSQSNSTSVAASAKFQTYFMIDHFCGFLDGTGTPSQFAPALENGEALAVTVESNGVPVLGELANAFTINAVHST